MAVLILLKRIGEAQLHRGPSQTRDTFAPSRDPGLFAGPNCQARMVAVQRGKNTGTEMKDAMETRGRTRNRGPCISMSRSSEHPSG